MTRDKPPHHPCCWAQGVTLPACFNPGHPKGCTYDIPTATLLARELSGSPCSCRLLQGIPDSVEFAGTIEEQYLQIGNSVPVPLGAALGTEFKRAQQLQAARETQEGGG